jgi:hypothetical protein
MGNRIVVMMFACFLAAGPARAADRLTDKELKELLEQIDHERDRFEDALDGNLKHSLLRNADREVDVGVFLDDLQENTGRLKSRYTGKYAASTEVTTVLRQGAGIDSFISQQPANFKGASEWAGLRSSLVTLAEAYGTTFPLAEGAAVRRLNDAEVRQAAQQVAQGAKEYRKALDNSLKAEPAIDKATRDAALREADALARDAKALGSRLGEGKPATGEARQLLDSAAKIQTSPMRTKLPPATQATWSSTTAAVEKVAQGFGLPNGPR